MSEYARGYGEGWSSWSSIRVWTEVHPVDTLVVVVSDLAAAVSDLERELEATR